MIVQDTCFVVKGLKLDAPNASAWVFTKPLSEKTKADEIQMMEILLVYNMRKLPLLREQTKADLEQFKACDGDSSGPGESCRPSALTIYSILISSYHSDVVLYMY